MALFHTTVVDNQIKALSTIGTASGSIATFETDKAERLVNLEVAITATQSGSGTPSPSNPRTINGFSACDLVACGKNLLDSSNKSTNEQYCVFGGVLGSNIPNGSLFLPQGDFTLLVSTTMTSIEIRDKDGNIITSASYSDRITFTNSNKQSILIVLRLYGASWNTLTYMLNSGATAKPYVAYNGTTETISFGQTIYGGRLNVGSGVLTVTHKIEDLSNYNWTYWNYGTHNLFYNTVSDKINNVKNYVICSHFEAVHDSANSLNVADDLLVNDNSIIASYLTSEPRFMVRCDTYTDALSFKNGVNGYKVVYELATPLTIQLDSKQIQAIIGTNNVYSDTGDIIDLKFVLSVGKAIS